MFVQHHNVHNVRLNWVN